MRYIGVEVPAEPITDFVIDCIITTYHLASRGRSYIGGVGIYPMPLSVANINDVVLAHPVIIDRATLDACVFAIDDTWLDEWHSKNKD